MEIEKVEKVVIEGGTINVPINIDNETSKEFLKQITEEARSSKEQNDIIIAQLREIVELLRKKRR